VKFHRNSGETQDIGKFIIPIETHLLDPFFLQLHYQRFGLRTIVAVNF
jgi:hypothetical protein